MDEAKQQVNRGVIEISHTLLSQETVFSEIILQLLDETNTQGMLRDNGTFAELRKRLLLPESYTVFAAMQQHFGHVWHIAVDSVDIPLPDTTDPFHDYPGVKPVYSIHINQEEGIRTPYLEKITFYPRRTV